MFSTWVVTSSICHLGGFLVLPSSVQSGCSSGTPSSPGITSSLLPLPHRGIFLSAGQLHATTGGGKKIWTIIHSAVVFLCLLCGATFALERNSSLTFLRCMGEEEKFWLVALRQNSLEHQLGGFLFGTENRVWGCVVPVWVLFLSLVFSEQLKFAFLFCFLLSPIYLIFNIQVQPGWLWSIPITWYGASPTHLGISKRPEQ